MESTNKLEPILFRLDEANELLWSEKPENREFFFHICNMCKNYPSIFLAYSASAMAMLKAGETAEGFSKLGINVFMPAEPVPLCAFSQAMTVRSAPLGLYLSTDDTRKLLKLTAISSHGGYFDSQDILSEKPQIKKDKTGVIGQTEMLNGYVNNLINLSDKYIEKGDYFAKLDIPFPALQKMLSEKEAPEILLKRNVIGYSAEVSDDGQKLTIFDQNNNKLPTSQIASIILKYLLKERFASGTVIGPTPLPDQEITEENYIEVSTVSDMAFNAGFTDLLLAWWHDGTIAHQGSSCFGDALLTAVYFLEAIRIA